MAANLKPKDTIVTYCMRHFRNTIFILLNGAPEACLKIQRDIGKKMHLKYNCCLKFNSLKGTFRCYKYFFLMNDCHFH